MIATTNYDVLFWCLTYLFHRKTRYHYLTNIDDENLTKPLLNTFKEEFRHRPITIHSFQSFRGHIELIEEK